ncbi:hypothetical protein QBC36DRAFT_324700 [Triangularia setosa]|uniref:CorA-like transporter domain-containing protein n=1 Tax=Triangularia setosa TaxID=2587417 RepID=A0AAN6WDD1_9PEZI|nr:hypothetical protein QBC36DRAFT_324700 [Podospora setosa]
MSSSNTKVDRYGKLEASCGPGFSNTWPANLLRTKSFRHTLISHRDNIQQEHQRLFDPNPDYALVEFLEAIDGRLRFHTTKCNSLPALQDHFQVNRKDPRCRHVFLETDHSRAPLDCSKEMFFYVMSFLQVMAPFVELLLGFGESGARKEFHYTSFRHESYLAASQAHRFSIPRLGRSGQEFRLCYNLWGVERSVGSNSSKWSIRQTAIFHAFDIESGRSLWVNISGNDNIKNRIIDAVASCDELRTESLVDLGGCFSSTLTTHLIAFEWCMENWRQYITYLETTLREIISEVEQTPVEQVERSLTLDTKGLLQSLKTPIEEPSQLDESTSVSPTSPGGPMGPRRTFTRRSTVNSTAMPPLRTRTLSGLTATTNQSFPRSPVRRGTAPFSPIVGQAQLPWARQGEYKIDEDQDPFDVLKTVSLDKLQKLNGIGADLHTASLVMKLDSEVVVDVLKYYEGFFESEEVPDDIRVGCRSSLDEFSRRTNSIVRSLEMEKMRIATLMVLLHDGRGLFEHILQFRNLEQGKLFNATAHLSQQRMEQLTVDMHNSTLNMEKVTESMHIIAQKTEKDTASMHIITMVTLVFLPGTFVAVRFGPPALFDCDFAALLTLIQTFFGSGLFQWDEENPETSIPVWKGDFFKLFAWICFPLMGATIFIWYFVYYWPYLREWVGRRWSKQKLTDIEQGPGGLAGLIDNSERQTKIQ